jgi:hypothetical protein
MIVEESGKDLLDWFEQEVKIWHYDPVETPPRAPYHIDELRTELYRRLRKSDHYNF